MTSVNKVNWPSIKELKRREFDNSILKANTQNSSYIESIKREADYAPNTPAAAQAIANTSNGKVALNATLEDSERIIRDIQAVVDDQEKQLRDRTNVITRKEQQVNELTQKVQEGTTLSKIRHEQVQALRKKYASNLHSSWFGLWRPLDETSRFGIFVAAIAFGCIGLLSIVYLVKYTSSPGSPVKSTSTSTSTGSSLFGGFRKRFLKN